MGTHGKTSSVAAAVQTARGRVADALPAILVYIVLFLGITALFGSSYTMVVSGAVCIFLGRKRRRNTPATSLIIGLVMLALSVLAWLASLNLALCIVLNLLVPFVLVLAQSNQFVPKGYFGYAMIFVFLELKPLTLEEFLIQTASVVFAAIVLGVALVAYSSLQRRRERDEDVFTRSLSTLADLLDRMASGERGQELRDAFLSLERTFDNLSITNHHFLRTWDRREFIFQMYAELFQRAVYLLADDEWQDDLARRVDPDILHELALLVRQANAAKTPEELRSIARMAQMALDMVDVPESRVRVFFHSFLHALALILQIQAEPPRKPASRRIPWNEVVDDAFRRMNRDEFEFRFACRLSLVTTLTCSISMVWGYEHVYWLPLNAILLLMPSYEESAHRMRTRPVGTVIGGALATFVSHYLPGTASVFAVSLTLISILYCCTPGSWVQAMLATMFALLMTSLTMNATTAAWLRILFVGLAVGIVLVINRFVVPSPRERIFEGNLRELTQLIREYWATVGRGARGATSLRAAGEQLARFHLMYASASKYVREMEDGHERQQLRAGLSTLWHMFSEVEQVEHLVLAEDLSQADLDALVRVATILETRPHPTSSHELLCELARSMESESLSFALLHYLDHASMYEQQVIGYAEA